MTEEMIRVMKELIRCYEICNSEDNPARKEITFWRERFLSTAKLPENKYEAANVWSSFLYMPSECFLRQSPEEYIENFMRYVNG